MKSKIISLFAMLIAVFLLTACDSDSTSKIDSVENTKSVIAKAQTMTLQELAAKAIEESNGKTFYGVGNSSRGKPALQAFISYLQTVNASYSMNIEWQQPKNNKIYDQLSADAQKKTGTFAMTLIQDGNQIESKMVKTGCLKTFIPKEWAEAKEISIDTYNGYLPFLTISKVFHYNICGTKYFHNCWDFVGMFTEYDDKGNPKKQKANVRPLFMKIDSETVGMNFLYMLTKDEYSLVLKEAFDALSDEAKEDLKPYIEEGERDAEKLNKTYAGKLNLGVNAKYALAWIKRFVKNYRSDTDDGPICNTLTKKSSKDSCGLFVYSKLRSVTESEEMSLNNIKVAAYEDEYKGFGGFGYCHYLFVTKNCPLPWTACAFINFLTTKQAGFEAWGKDIGCYSSNPKVSEENEAKYHHSTAGFNANGDNAFPVKNDKGAEWWLNQEPGKIKLVLEDPEYCSKVAFTVGRWIDQMAE